MDNIAGLLCSYASAGRTAATEAVLAQAGPTPPRADLVRALQAAAAHRRWSTVAYLAGYLADTEPLPAADDAAVDVAALVVAVETTGGAALGPDESASDDASASDDEGASVDDDPDIIEFPQIVARVPPGELGSKERPLTFFSISKPDYSSAYLQGRDEVVISAPSVRVELHHPRGVISPPSLIEAPPGARHITRGHLARGVAALGAAGSAAHDAAELSLVRVRRQAPGLYAAELAA